MTIILRAFSLPDEFRSDGLRNKRGIDGVFVQWQPRRAPVVENIEDIAVIRLESGVG